MFGIGWTEILIVLAIFFIVFGLPKIPQIGEALGKGIRNFQNALKDKSSGNDKEKKEDNTKKD